MTEVDPKPIPFHYSAHTVRLIKYLEGLYVSGDKGTDLVKYQEIREDTGLPVKSEEGSGCHLDTAIKHMRRQHQIPIKRVGTGIKILTPEEHVRQTSSDRVSVSRTAKKRLEFATLADTSAVPEEKQYEHIVNMAQLQMAQKASSVSPHKKMLAAKESKGELPSVDDIVKMFGK